MFSKKLYEKLSFIELQGKGRDEIILFTMNVINGVAVYSGPLSPDSGPPSLQTALSGARAILFCLEGDPVDSL